MVRPVKNSRDDAPNSSPTQRRFAVSRWTLFSDWFMNRLIQLGGITVIIAVFGILVFIGAQAWPLFGGAKVGAEQKLDLQAPVGALVGTDDSGRATFVAAPDGTVTFYDAKQNPFQTWRPKLPENVRITTQNLQPDRAGLIYGLSNGQAFTLALNFSTHRDEEGNSISQASPEAGESILVGLTDVPVTEIFFAAGAEGKIFAAIQIPGTQRELRITQVKERRSLMGRSRQEATEPLLLGRQLTAPLATVTLAGNGNILLTDTDGGIWTFYDNEGEIAPRQPVFHPFPGKKIAALGLLFGDTSLVLVAENGENVIWALTPRKDAAGQIARVWQHTKTFPPLPGKTFRFARSPVNKAFLLASEQTASIRHSTTESVRWEDTLAFSPSAISFGPHYDSLLFLDAQGALHSRPLRDPHPEGGWKAFFGKIWYEGAAQPEWTWQSSSGNDDFEPKLSLMPLIFGTVKGTFYAMLFALPVSLLAALYMSQFLRPEYKRIIKPIMEIMASLPSVVLGFIAALWLAPRIENHVPALLLLTLSLPLAAMALGFLWSRFSARVRHLIPPGWEFAALLPLILLVGFFSWEMGPVVERWFFSWQDPATGEIVGNFRLWWTHLSGLSFEQRNCLVVGFIMGFAVIPVIFTIAEDALSNVPRSLVSASLALGASRWQTAWRVVVPTASAGIFSGIMIGFGRAIGETMIVVMATGNTAVMDWNIFNGMRTLSANIAVELPEAAVGSTHYRALFLGACCLFLLTFVLNTVAELLRQRLREKYKVV